MYFALQLGNCLFIFKILQCKKTLIAKYNAYIYICVQLVPQLALHGCNHNKRGQRSWM
jgi:hypothetical protein